MNTSTVICGAPKQKKHFNEEKFAHIINFLYLCSRFFELSKTNIGNNNRCLMNIEKHV